MYYQKTDPYSSHMVIGKIISDLGKSNSKLLDLGCDVGFLGKTLNILNIKCTIDGVDVNKENLKIAGRNYNKTFMFDLNSQSWPIKDKYDLVVLADTIEHLHSPKNTLSNVYRLLKKNGILIISVPNIVFWWARLQILIGRFPKENRGIFDKTHLHFFTKKTLLDLLLLDNRYKPNSFHTTTFPIQFIFNKENQSLILKFIYNFNYLLSKVWPNIFSYQLIYVVSKI